MLARRALIEGAWTYRMTARVSRKQRGAAAGHPRHRREGPTRLCSRYRRLAAAGKPKVVVTTAIPREMVGFIWATVQIAQPALES